MVSKLVLGLVVPFLHIRNLLLTLSSTVALLASSTSYLSQIPTEIVP